MLAGSTTLAAVYNYICIIFQFEQIFGRFLILLNRHPGDRSEGAVARLPRQGRGAHRRRPREQLCRQNQEAGAGESALHVRHR